MTPTPRTAWASFWLAVVGALVVTPLLVLLVVLGSVLLIWWTHVGVSIPWFVEGRYDGSTPGGSVEGETGPGFGWFVVLLAAALWALLYRLDRAPVRERVTKSSLAE